MRVAKLQDGGFKMIGCIVTGHGDFAPGLTRAVEMIAGKQDYLENYRKRVWS